MATKSMLLGMAERQKRKLRRKRVTNIEDMGLEPGKLYSFQGRFRYLYKEKKPEWTKVHTKIRKGDYIMFLKADLWHSTATKSKIVVVNSSARVIAELEKKGYAVVGKRKHGWRQHRIQIDYKPKEPIYSGMMYVGFGDRFGWINIVQMSKEAVLKQFEKVKIEQ